MKLYPSFYNKHREEACHLLYKKSRKDWMMKEIYKEFGWQAFSRSSVLVGFCDALSDFNVKGTTALVAQLPSSWFAAENSPRRLAAERPALPKWLLVERSLAEYLRLRTGWMPARSHR